jgi:hypothetical protein
VPSVHYQRQLQFLLPSFSSTSRTRPQILLRLLKLGLAMFLCVVHGLLHEVRRSLICLGKPAYNGSYVHQVIKFISTNIFSFRYPFGTPFPFNAYTYLLVR